MIQLTLGNDSEARKRVQLVAAFLRYIPAAAMQFALHSKEGNDKHNPGQPVHHARGKSADHEECILRHLVDLQDIRAYMERNQPVGRDWLPDDEIVRLLISEARAEFWRAGIFLQELCERFLGAPLAPAARLPEPSVEPKVPRIVDGTNYGAPFAMLDGFDNLIGLYPTAEAADASLCALLGFPGPVNTPAEAAELERARGTVVLVGAPAEPARDWLSTYLDEPEAERAVGMVPELAAGFGTPFHDCPSERGNGVDEAFARCAHVSRTKRVCVAEAGHAGKHGDTWALWGDGE